MSAFIDLFHDSMCALSLMRRGGLADWMKPCCLQTLLEVTGNELDPASGVEQRAGRSLRVRNAEPSARRVLIPGAGSQELTQAEQKRRKVEQSAARTEQRAAV